VPQAADREEGRYLLWVQADRTESVAQLLAMNGATIALVEAVEYLQTHEHAGSIKPGKTVRYVRPQVTSEPQPTSTHRHIHATKLCREMETYW
jgi:predicted transcriptional regulator